MKLYRNALETLGNFVGWNIPACRKACFQKIVLPAEGGLAIQLPRHSWQQVACRRGILWITQEGNGEDIILREGERITLRGRGKIFIQALTAASFLMRRTAQAA